MTGISRSQNYEILLYDKKWVALKGDSQNIYLVPYDNNGNILYMAGYMGGLNNEQALSTITNMYKGLGDFVSSSYLLSSTYDISLFKSLVDNNKLSSNFNFNISGVLYSFRDKPTEEEQKLTTHYYSGTANGCLTENLPNMIWTPGAWQQSGYQGGSVSYYAYGATMVSIDGGTKTQIPLWLSNGEYTGYYRGYKLGFIPVICINKKYVSNVGTGTLKDPIVINQTKNTLQSLDVSTGTYVNYKPDGGNYTVYKEFSGYSQDQTFSVANEYQKFVVLDKDDQYTSIVPTKPLMLTLCGSRGFIMSDVIMEYFYDLYFAKNLDSEQVETFSTHSDLEGSTLKTNEEKLQYLLQTDKKLRYDDFYAIGDPEYGYTDFDTDKPNGQNLMLGFDYFGANNVVGSSFGTDYGDTLYYYVGQGYYVGYLNHNVKFWTKGTKSIDINDSYDDYAHKVGSLGYYMDGADGSGNYLYYREHNLFHEYIKECDYNTIYNNYSHNISNEQKNVINSELTRVISTSGSNFGILKQLFIPIIKISNTEIVSNGNGTRESPYTIEM